MKRVHIVGRDPEKIREMKSRLESKGFVYVEENPEVVISYGGDGMFLIAERIFPGVPKILIRDSEVGNQAHDRDILEIMDFCSQDLCDIEEIRKLKAVHRGRFEVRSLVGVNDIVIRNSLPTEAIRFRYRIKGGEWSHVFIGDGLVISTPYGSSKGAYFYSIAQRSFDSGIGMAFNNVTEKTEPVFISSKDEFEVELVRGFGVLVSDNNRDFINLESGDKVEVGLADEVAQRIILKDG